MATPMVGSGDTFEFPQNPSPVEAIASRLLEWRSVAITLSDYSKELSEYFRVSSASQNKLVTLLNRGPTPLSNSRDGAEGLSEVPAALLALHNELIKLQRKSSNDLQAQTAKLKSIAQEAQSRAETIRGYAKHFGSTDVTSFQKNLAKEEEAYANVLNEIKQSGSISQDPYIARSRVDRLYGEQVKRENTLLENYHNVQTLGGKYDSKIVSDLQEAIRVIHASFTAIGSADLALAKGLDENVLQYDPDEEWGEFVLNNKSYFITEDVASKDPNEVTYPGHDSPYAQAVRRGTLERRTKYLHSYQPAQYLLTLYSLYEIKDDHRTLGIDLSDAELLNDHKHSTGDKFVLSARQQSSASGKHHTFVFRTDDAASWRQDLTAILKTPVKDRSSLIGTPGFGNIEDLRVGKGSSEFATKSSVPASTNVPASDVSTNLDAEKQPGLASKNLPSKERSTANADTGAGAAVGAAGAGGLAAGGLTTAGLKGPKDDTSSSYSKTQDNVTGSALGVDPKADLAFAGSSGADPALSTRAVHDSDLTSKDNKLGEFNITGNKPQYDVGTKDNVYAGLAGAGVGGLAGAGIASASKSGNQELEIADGNQTKALNADQDAGKFNITGDQPDYDVGVKENFARPADFGVAPAGAGAGLTSVDESAQDANLGEFNISGKEPQYDVGVKESVYPSSATAGAAAGAGAGLGAGGAGLLQSKSASGKNTQAETGEFNTTGGQSGYDVGSQGDGLARSQVPEITDAPATSAQDKSLGEFNVSGDAPGTDVGTKYNVYTGSAAGAAAGATASSATVTKSNANTSKGGYTSDVSSVSELSQSGALDSNSSPTTDTGAPPHSAAWQAEQDLAAFENRDPDEFKDQSSVFSYDLKHKPTTYTEDDDFTPAEADVPPAVERKLTETHHKFEDSPLEGIGAARLANETAEDSENHFQRRRSSVSLHRSGPPSRRATASYGGDELKPLTTEGKAELFFADDLPTTTSGKK